VNRRRARIAECRHHLRRAPDPSPGLTHPARASPSHEDSTPRHPPDRAAAPRPPARLAAVPASRSCHANDCRRARPRPAAARQRLQRRRGRELPAARAPRGALRRGRRRPAPGRSCARRRCWAPWSCWRPWPRSRTEGRRGDGAARHRRCGALAAEAVAGAGEARRAGPDPDANGREAGCRGPDLAAPVVGTGAGLVGCLAHPIGDRVVAGRPGRLPRGPTSPPAGDPDHPLATAPELWVQAYPYVLRDDNGAPGGVL